MDDQAIIAGILEKDDSIYKKLYDEYYPLIEKYVLQNSGDTHDAKDIFQDITIILFDKASKQNLHLTSSLKTFIYSIGRNLWLKKLREKKGVNVNDSEYIEESPEDKIIENEINKNLLQKLGRAFHKMTNHCKILLYSMFFKKKSPINIMEEKGYKNIHTVQNQKYKCLKQARNEFKK